MNTPWILSEYILIDKLDFDTLFPYTVKWLVPRDIYKEKAVQDSLTHSFKNLKELVKQLEEKEGNTELLKSKLLKLDSQKKRVVDSIKENERKIKEISERMNEGLSPYTWCLDRNVDQRIDVYDIKCDYLLSLLKVTESGIPVLHYY